MIQGVKNYILSGVRAVRNLKIKKIAVPFLLGQSCLYLALLCISNTVVAQSSQELDRESLQQFRQEQERLRQQREQLQPQSDTRISSLDNIELPLVFPEEETPCFEISKISMIAIESPLRRWEWLYDHIDHSQDTQPVLGRCLGAQGVGVVMARLQQALVQQGWITTRVLAPPQDLSSGELQLNVLARISHSTSASIAPKPSYH